ncbi:FecR family protein [Aquimarina hainanensis]|uniref:FecR family protein n=1 Tax=Aquimarina hainanensis TaxID=1578017 RepID=A0ABW5NFH4_9FLAO
MEQKNTDNTFLVRWLNNELTKEELEAFEQSEKTERIRYTIKKIGTLDAPQYKEEEILKQIKEQLNEASKMRPLFPKWLYMAAASVAILLGMYYFFDNSTKFETTYGETKVVSLPDGSEIKLNAKTQVSYDKENWDANRTVLLDGEAYFEVEKGSAFVVKTKEGAVTVLGTRFNTKVEKGFIEVQCHEGRVKVSGTTIGERILNKGDAFRKINETQKNWKIEEEVPSWIKGESTFAEVPIHYVITALQKQFDVVFEVHSIDQRVLYTGGFAHDNLEIALKTVFDPMRISYIFKDKTTIVLEAE